MTGGSWTLLQLQEAAWRGHCNEKVPAGWMTRPTSITVQSILYVVAGANLYAQKKSEPRPHIFTVADPILLAFTDGKLVTFFLTVRKITDGWEPWP